MAHLGHKGPGTENHERVLKQQKLLGRCQTDCRRDCYSVTSSKVLPRHGFPRLEPGLNTLRYLARIDEPLHDEIPLRAFGRKRKKLAGGALGILLCGVLARAHGVLDPESLGDVFFVVLRTLLVDLVFFVFVEIGVCLH